MGFVDEEEVEEEIPFTKAARRGWDFYEETRRRAEMETVGAFARAVGRSGWDGSRCPLLPSSTGHGSIRARTVCFVERRYLRPSQTLKNCRN